MQRGQAPSGWWRRLSVVHAPVRHFQAGGTGFLMADLSQEEGALGGGGGAPDQARALVAFADRNDAQRVQWLWDSWGEEEPGRNRRVSAPCRREESPLWALRSGGCSPTACCTGGPCAGLLVSLAASRAN